MILLRVVLGLIVVLGSAGVARAELVPVAHTTHVKREGLVYRATIRLTVEQQGQDPFNDTIVTLPQAGAVVGMRLLSDGGRDVVEGQILGADDASLRFGVLASHGQHAPHAVALLSWDSLGSVDLGFTQLRAGERVSVELEVLGMVTLDDSAHATVDVPCAGASSVRSDGQVSADELVKQSPQGLDRSFFELPRCQVRWDSDLQHGIRLTWSSLAVGKQTFSFVGLELAAELAAPPDDARVVFVVDTSMSEGVDGVMSELEVVASTAAQFPGGQIAVVAYDHGARVITDFVPAAQLPGVLGGSAWRVHHGSDADAGLEAAARLLAGKQGTPRVIVLGDLDLAFRQTGSRLLDAGGGLPAGTVVHVVMRQASEGEPSSGRLDTLDAPADDFIPLLRATGGQMLDISGDVRGEHARAMARITLGLVHPIQLDDVQLTGVPGNPLDNDPVLAQGWGEVWAMLGDAPVPRVRLTGRLWGRALDLAPPPSPELAPLMPALLFASEWAGNVEAGDAERLGLQAGVLTPMTSYLAVARGSGPSRLGAGEPGGFGMRTSGLCSCDGIASNGVLGRMGAMGGRRVDPRQRLVTLLTPLVARCLAGQAPGHGVVVVEVSGPEVLGVWAARSKAASCIEDAVWRLPDPVVGPHTTYVISLSELVRRP